MLVENSRLESRPTRLGTVSVTCVAVVLACFVAALSLVPRLAAEEEKQGPERKSSTKKVDFAIGPQKFTGDDKIVIGEVWSECGSLAKGDTVTVKGTYTLYSRPTATLLLGVTKSGKKLQGGSTLEREIEQGVVPFETKLPVTIDGHLHMSLFDVENHVCFGTVYFGTYPQMEEIADWDVDSWVRDARKAGRKGGRKDASAKSRATPTASVPEPELEARRAEFTIGPRKFTSGDTIDINEVWSTRGTLAKGDTVIVKGTYTLYSRPLATMLLSVTHDPGKGPQGGSTTERQIEAGNAVPFAIELPVTVHGHLHVSFYDVETHRSFATLYFGTYDQMREIADWDLDKW